MNYLKRKIRKRRKHLRQIMLRLYKIRLTGSYDNGCIILEPRELTIPDSISVATLRDMDKAVNNFQMGDVSQPVDLSDF